MSIFVSTIIASARADDFPIKKLSPFTWVVDYESFWSPDSRQIVLVSSRHGGMKVHVMNADSASHGSDTRQLTFGSDEDDSPAWSPDGKKIDVVCPTDLALAAFNRAGEPKQLELYPGGHFSAYPTSSTARRRPPPSGSRSICGLRRESPASKARALPSRIRKCRRLPSQAESIRIGVA